MVPPDSLYWRYNKSMPLVNGVDSPYSLRKEAGAYLAQRDSKALSRATATRDFPPDYWKSSNLGLLAPVLDRLGSPRFFDRRSAYLNLVWKAAPDGRKKGVYSSGGAYPCPLCGHDDSLEHIVLRCPGLAQQRREIWEAEARPYAYGVAPPEPPPPGCTERVRQYL
jgi:hypothetical protein